SPGRPPAPMSSPSRTSFPGTDVSADIGKTTDLRWISPIHRLPGGMNAAWAQPSRRMAADTSLKHSADTTS
ncbi:MAG: hypothetical protein M3Y29_03420, partial [Chloroflexota bacterium]|nr:hypothetical protein [Chloroflexota bacterium]